MTVLYILIALNYLFLLLGTVTTLFLTTSFSRTQRARFPVLRLRDGRQLGLAVAAVVFFALGYAVYGLKETVLAQQSFRVALGPGTSQVVQATETGIDLELKEAAAHKANAARESFNTGQANFGAGRYREAAEDYQRSIEALPTLSAILNRGLSLRYLPDFSAAEAVLRTGLQIASEQHRERFEAHFSLYLSSVLHGQGKNSDAKPFIVRALKIYERLGDDLGQANAHLNMGNNLSFAGPNAESNNEYRLALSGFSRAGNILGQANVNNNLALEYGRKLQLGEATKAFESALASYEAIDNETGIARASEGLAVVYLIQGRTAEALTLSREALGRAVRQGDKERRAGALCNIGALLDEQGKFAEAIVAAESSLQLSRDIGSSEGEAVAHIVLESAYRGLGRLHDAHDHGIIAVEIFTKNGDSRSLSAAFSELGASYLAERRFVEAEDAFRKALAIADANPELLLEQAAARAGLGMTEASLGNSERALQFLLLAHNTFSRAGAKYKSARETDQLITRLQRERQESRE